MGKLFPSSLTKFPEVEQGPVWMQNRAGEAGKSTRNTGRVRWSLWIHLALPRFFPNHSPLAEESNCVGKGQGEVELLNALLRGEVELESTERKTQGG